MRCANTQGGRESGVCGIRIFQVQKRLKKYFGLNYIWKGGLRLHETVSTGKSDGLCRMRLVYFFLLYPNLCSALATASPTAAALRSSRRVMSLAVVWIQTSPFRKGYSPFNWDPNQYRGWMTLQRSLMFEDGLGKVMQGLETDSAAPEEDATQVQRVSYAKESRRFEDQKCIFFV